jgi:hypothetical protein
LHDAGSSSIPNLLLGNPNGRHRPELRHGEHLTIPGVFTLTVLSSSGSSARVRFNWKDATAPRVPRFTTAVDAGRLKVLLEGAHESGSGVAHYDITVDGRAPVSVGTDATEEPVQVGRPLPGTHTVRVVVFDRAGNRSPAGVRRVRVP